MKILTMRVADLDGKGVIITTDTGLTIGTPRSAESIYWPEICAYIDAGGVIDPVIVAPDTPPELP